MKLSLTWVCELCKSVLVVIEQRKIIIRGKIMRTTLVRLALVIPFVSAVLAAPLSNLRNVDSYFSGRGKVMAKLNLELDKSHLLQINGISGVGKTALATAYANVNGCKYDVVWWVNGRSELLSQCTQFLKLVEKSTGIQAPKVIAQASEDGIFGYIFDQFKDKHMLVIIDDVQELKGSVLRLVQEAKSKAEVDVLITCQKSIPEISSIALDSMSMSDVSELIHRYFPDVSERDVTALADKLHMFPIALCQALRYMKFHGFDINTYLQSLEKDEKGLHSQESKFIHKHKDHLVMWDPKHDSADLVIKKYLQDTVARDERLQQVVNALPFLSQQYVSKAFMSGYLKHAHDFESGYQSLYGRLLETGLLMPAATGEGFFYHEIIRYITPSDTVVKEAAVKVGAYLISLMAGQEITNFPADEYGNREYIDHVCAYLDMCQKIGMETEDTLKLRILLSYYIEYVKRSSHVCLKHIKLVDSSSLLPKLPVYYRAMHAAIAAKIYFKTSGHDKKDADEHYKRFMAVWKEAESAPEFRVMKLRVLSVIMSHLLMRQRTDLVAPLIASGDKTLDQVSEPFQKLCFTRIKCWYLNEKGEPAEADKITDDMWPLFKDTTYGSLKGQYALDKTISLIKIKSLRKAEKYAEAALDHFNSYFGHRVVDLKAEIAGILGNIYMMQGKYKQALPILERSISDYRKAYKKDGQVSWQIEAKLFLSQCLMGLGRVTEALEKAYEVEHEFNRLVGDNAKSNLAKNIYVQIIKASWLAKQPGITGRYLARYDTRFGKALDPKILPDLVEETKG